MKTKKSITVLVCVLTAVFFAANTIAEVTKAKGAEKIDLKLNLKKGQKFSQCMNIDQNINQTVNGKPMNMVQKMTMWSMVEILDVDANNITKLKTNYQRIKMQMDGPGGSVGFDSNSPIQEANNPQVKILGEVYQALIGQDIVMKLTPRGKIVGIEGFDKMMDAMMSKMAKKDPNMADAMKKMMKNIMSEDRLKQMNNGMTIGLPDFPVGVGDVWYDTVSLGEGFPLDLSVTYMLKDRKDGKAIIDAISKMDMGDEDSKFIETNGMKMNMQLSGVMTGTSEVDETAGWMMKNKTKQNFSGVIKMAGNEQKPEGMTIPMSIDGTVTMEGKEIK